MLHGNIDFPSGNVNFGAQFSNAMGMFLFLGLLSNYVGQSNVSRVDQSREAQFNPQTPFTGPKVFSVGKSNPFKSRKRSRRSFSHSPDMDRINIKAASNYVEVIAPVCPDLDANSTEGEAGDVVFDVNPVTLSQPEFQSVNEGGGDVVAAPVLADDMIEADFINNEVDATIKVGQVVGINLNSFSGSIATEVIAELGVSGGQ